MSFWAQLVGVAADASLAGLQHSQFNYADPKAVAAQKAKAAGCTPCAIAARRERAAQAVAIGTGATPPPRARPRRVLAP